MIVQGPDFIGIGAQKSGTSWIYACLVEHPEIFMPIKEAHFFSRERNWQRGFEWYESLFQQRQRQARQKICGEFSTSYLCDTFAPARIHERYPNVRLVACLRNPVERAFSNYKNDLMAGAIPRNQPFEEALRQHPEYLSQGKYSTQLKRYLELFPREQLLILFYEDSRVSPVEFIQNIYRFLGVNPSFRPSMLWREVNSSMTPRFSWVNQAIERVSQGVQRAGLKRLWWLIKRSGIPDMLRWSNAVAEPQLKPELRSQLNSYFEEDRIILEKLLHRSLAVWAR